MGKNQERRQNQSGKHQESPTNMKAWSEIHDSTTAQNPRQNQSLHKIPDQEPFVRQQSPNSQNPQSHPARSSQPRPPRRNTEQNNARRIENGNESAQHQNDHEWVQQKCSSKITRHNGTQGSSPTTARTRIPRQIVKETRGTAKPQAGENPRAHGRNESDKQQQTFEAGVARVCDVWAN